MSLSSGRHASLKSLCINMRPDTIEVQNIPAPKSSPTISSDLSLEAAAIDENMSGHPLPKARRVTPLRAGSHSCADVSKMNSAGSCYVSG